MEEQAKKESLLAAYKVPGFRAQARVAVYEIKDRPALVITLERRQKNGVFRLQHSASQLLRQEMVSHPRH